MPKQIRGFEKGLAGGGWRPTAATIQPFLPQTWLLLHIRGHRKKGAENRPESMVREDFFALTPSVCQPLLETSASKKASRDAYGQGPSIFRCALDSSGNTVGTTIIAEPETCFQHF